MQIYSPRGELRKPETFKPSEIDALDDDQRTVFDDYASAVEGEKNCEAILQSKTSALYATVRALDAAKIALSRSLDTSTPPMAVGPADVSPEQKEERQRRYEMMARENARIAETRRVISGSRPMTAAQIKAARAAEKKLALKAAPLVATVDKCQADLVTARQAQTDAKAALSTAREALAKAIFALAKLNPPQVREDAVKDAAKAWKPNTEARPVHLNPIDEIMSRPKAGTLGRPAMKFF
jgi:uncharacterized protein YgbK (DUF1537 family)